jgi:hypothetical protein
MTLQEINFHSNYQLLANLLLEFNKKKPNKTDIYIKALSEIYFYINSMQIENREIELENSDIRNKYLKQKLEFYDYKNKTI